MPELIHTLQGHDLGFLKMVAGLWGIELDAPDAPSALPILLATLRQRALVNEVIDSLPESARQALQDLIDHDGRLPWALFERRYGQVRQMGAGRRDRIRPDLEPASTAEVLWYRGLIGQAFLNLSPEAQEYAYIPEDLLALMALTPSQAARPFGRPASPLEQKIQRLVDDAILDQACTLLAALRLQLPAEDIPVPENPAPLRDLQALLFTANLLDGSQIPQPEPVRAFLAAPRGEALALLARAWMQSGSYNELRLIPGLVCEGDWVNDPRVARREVMAMLSLIPADSWWSLEAFVNDVRENAPDFQRPAGDYDSWFIRRADSGHYLRGFAAWDEVDGALLRYMISGPLHWLGFLDLGASEDHSSPQAFRLSRWAQDLWLGKPPAGLDEENEPVRVNSHGQILVPRRAPRAVRYQVARFTTWLPPQNNFLQYQISPQALDRASQQGLKPAQLINLLRKHANAPLPPNLFQLLKRWESHGVQAKIETVSLLRVNSPEILNALRKTGAARYLGENLSDTLVVLRPGVEEKVLRALAEIGYLGEISR